MQKSQNVMVIAMESVNEEVEAVITEPAVDIATPEADVAAGEQVDALITQGEDIDADVDTLVDMSVGLESIAEVMAANDYATAPETETLSPLELTGVNTALEDANQEPAKAGDSKQSVFQRVKAGAGKVLEWLLATVSKLTDWVVETFQRVFQPLNTYSARLKSLQGQKLSDVIPEAIAKQLAAGDTPLKSLEGYLRMLKATNAVNSPDLANKAVAALKADGGAENVRKVFVELKQKYTTIYNQKLDDGYMGTQMLAGGKRFEMKATENSFDHRVHTDPQAPDLKTALSEGELAKVHGVAQQLYVEIVKAKNKDGAPALFKSIAARVKALVGENKEMTAEAKALVYAIPKILKSPAIDIALQATKVMGAVVKLGEAQAKAAASANKA